MAASAGLAAKLHDEAPSRSGNPEIIHFPRSTSSFRQLVPVQSDLQKVGTKRKMDGVQIDEIDETTPPLKRFGNSGKEGLHNCVK